jgi:tetratricopeptide (TPR) repeat protein
MGVDPHRSTLPPTDDPRDAGRHHRLEQELLVAEVQQRLFGGSGSDVRLSRYELLDRIGAGGLGAVYAAYDPKLERRVAIKLLQSGARGDLLDEAKAMARLSHPNVVEVYDVGTFDEPVGGARSGVFIVMELIEGPTLHQWLRARRRTWREIVAVYAAAGRGLAAAHRAGLVHRDFKPANVMIADERRPIVLDFGLARPPEAFPSHDRPHVVAGTPAFMAPEQWEGGQLDGRADQYAFCTALFAALYGTLPFGDVRGAELQLHKKLGKTRAVSTREVPARVHESLVRGLAPDPDQRFEDMEALLDALDRDPARRRRRRLAAAAAAIGLGAIAWVIGTSDGRTDCATAPVELDGVWDDTRRASVEAAFAASGVPFSDASARRVRERLDRRAAHWLELREEVCLGEARSDLEPPTLAFRTECLEQRRRELRSLVAVFEQADPTIVGRAAAIVDGLAPLSTCMGRGPAQIRVAVPEARQEARARAQALYDAGKYHDALQVLEEAEPSREQADPGTHVLWGRLRAKTGDTADAAVLLYDALERGQAMGDDRVVAAAAIALTGVVGFELDRGEEARRLGRLALATIERLGGDPVLEGDAQTMLGALARREGDHASARERFERALALRIAAYGESSLLVAAALNNLALAQGSLDDQRGKQATLRRSVAMMEAVVGSEHPDLAVALTNLGIVTGHLGDEDQGIALLERGLRIRRRALGPEHTAAAGSELELGKALFRRGDPARARDLCRHARTVLEHADEPAHPRVAAAAECEAQAREALVAEASGPR